MPKKTFTVEDLQRWQEKGLISQEQLQGIVTGEDLEAAPEAGPATPPAETGRKARLDPVTVAYYFGGLLALLSFTIFITARWDELSSGERLATALAVLAATGCLGAWLRFARSYHVAGGLILLITTAIFPLFVYTVADMAGIWPSGDSFEEMSYGFLFMSLISLPVAGLILALTRFSLISVAVAGLVHFATMAIGGIASADLAIVTCVTCGVFILLAIWLSLTGKRQHVFWLKLYGLAGLLAGLITLFFDSENALFGILFLAVYLIIIAFSIYSQEVIYLIFGIIGVYTYIIRLIFDYLRDTAYFPLVLGIIGISIVVLAVFYQRYQSSLFRRKPRA